MIPGDIQDDPMIRYIVLGFACTGILMYILYSLLKTWTMRQYLYTVSAVNALTPDSTEIVMVPQGKGIFPLPGQFAFFSFINSDILPKESHPFTISSWTGTGSLILSAKSLGDYTSQLSHEHIGEEVNVEGPYGEFSYLYGSSKQVWVAGGIGVTPFVAMVEHMLTQETLPYQIDFFYSTRTKQDALYQDIFQSAAQKFPSFMYHPMPSDTEGYITGEFLVEKVQGILLKDIFICGPPPMMKALIASLTGLGINKRRIHSELFALLK
jgi:predicted ferric reductase